MADYLVTEDIMGYPECPEDDGSTKEIPLKKGDKLTLKEFNEYAMEFLTKDGVVVCLNRSWDDSPICDYKKYFNLPKGIERIN